MHSINVAELIIGIGAIALAVAAFEFGYWLRGREIAAGERLRLLRERSGALASSPEMADKMDFKQEVH